MSDTTQFRVLDLDCPTCASTVERAIENLGGVHAVDVHYATGRVEVEYDDGVADPDAIAGTIEDQGYTPQSA